MSIPVGGDVGLEMHANVDQFLRVESGTAQVMTGSATTLGYVKDVGPGDAILVPSGTWHNIVNTGTAPLKLHSLYGPAQHPQGTVHVTQPVEDHGTAHPSVGAVTPVAPFTKDPGATPFVLDVEAATLANTNFRTAAWTADTLQLTLMSIPVGGDVGLEMHSNVDQFLRVESGMAKVYFGDSQGNVRFAGVAHKDSAILVPSGTWHNIVNASPKEPLKLYSLYGPAQHPQGTIHVTQADGEHH
jgi:mannose-6-phosphate isomerase-like protein (cupin superfamily)